MRRPSPPPGDAAALPNSGHRPTACASSDDDAAAESASEGTAGAAVGDVRLFAARGEGLNATVAPVDGDGATELARSSVVVVSCAATRAPSGCDGRERGAMLRSIKKREIWRYGRYGNEGSEGAWRAGGGHLICELLAAPVVRELLAPPIELFLLVRLATQPTNMRTDGRPEHNERSHNPGFPSF